MILRKKKSAPAEVPLSPLIDCVFLLLIFFLVTSMLKKTEKQLPIRMPDTELSAADQADQQVITLGIDRDGNLSIGQGGTTDKMIEFQPLADLNVFLDNLKATGRANTPIQFAVEAGTETQTVIRIMDTFHHKGFDRVFVRLRSDDYITENLEGN